VCPCEHVSPWAPPWLQWTINRLEIIALTDIKRRTLKPCEKAYQEGDDGGVFVEAMPGGAIRWRLRYHLAGKQEKVTLGEYPTYSVAEATRWRDACKVLAGRGVSPMAMKRGDPIPEEASHAGRELAQAFIQDWCLTAREKARAKEEAKKAADAVGAFAWRWYREIAEPKNSNPRNIKRVLEKDVIPSIGDKPIAAVTVTDVLAITDGVKARGGGSDGPADP
jgi:hypothetical protein